MLILVPLHVPRTATPAIKAITPHPSLAPDLGSHIQGMHSIHSQNHNTENYQRYTWLDLTWLP